MDKSFNSHELNPTFHIGSTRKEKKYNRKPQKKDIIILRAVTLQIKMGDFAKVLIRL